MAHWERSRSALRAQDPHDAELGREAHGEVLRGVTTRSAVGLLRGGEPPCLAPTWKTGEGLSWIGYSAGLRVGF